jgi:tRNA 2-thiouridine synthesizing protein A
MKHRNSERKRHVARGRRGEARGSRADTGDPSMDARATLDTVGLLCPAPIMKAAQRIQELQSGQILEIISDDPGIEVDMPAWCRSTGNELLRIEKRGLQLHVLVRKGGSSCPDV